MRSKFDELMDYVRELRLLDENGYNCKQEISDAISEIKTELSIERRPTEIQLPTCSHNFSVPEHDVNYTISLDFHTTDDLVEELTKRDGVNSYRMTDAIPENWSDVGTIITVSKPQ